MNFHMQELANKCHSEDGLHFDHVKFAELVIRECARISDECDDTMTNQGAASAQEFMKHFGIE